MKNYLLYVCVVVLLTSCFSSENTKTLEKANAKLVEENMAKDRSYNDLLSVMNAIDENLSLIKEKENIVTVYSGENTPHVSQRIKADIETLVSLLNENRMQVKELNARLKKSNLHSDALQAMVDRMSKKSIEQAEELVRLKQSLSDKSIEVASLNVLLDSLKLDLTEKLLSKEDEMHKAWYVVANKRELKSAHVLTKSDSFLGSNKLLESSFDSTFFNELDTREVVEIYIGNNKAKVLTSHPKDSYEFIKDGDKLILNIKDASLFWSISRYLVVQI